MMDTSNNPDPAGLIIAAPASGSGKTTLTLALLRHWRNSNIPVASVKVGPDYIDPGFHRAASGRVCYNLDSWAMRPATLAGLIRQAGAAARCVLAEGVMGLFDGAGDGRGSTAEVAELTGWPVVLVIDAQGMAASAAAVVHGFNSWRPETRLAGVIFNRIGGPGHAELLRTACQPLAVPVLGCIPRNNDLILPDRHLGLVPAQEHSELEGFLDRAAEFVADYLDTEALLALAKPSLSARAAMTPTHDLAPLGQRIAVANDIAFSFCYPHLLKRWQAAGVEILPFSPLAGETPDPHADAIYLPGGYPELHAGRIADNRGFIRNLRQAAQRAIPLYGECGGYMVLGQGLVDATGETHAMAGLLPLETSFAERQLHLGYRRLTLLADGILGTAGDCFRGHEFHFSKLTFTGQAAALFHVQDALGQDLGAAGMQLGSVGGSFMHLIDSE